MAKFFRIFLPEYRETMSIPVVFGKQLTDKSGTAASIASISSPLGRIWHVGLSREGTCTYFTEGWPEFVEAHEMDFGDMMVFSYEGQSNFSVEIFDRSTCLKVYNCSSPGKTNIQKDLLLTNGRRSPDVSPNAKSSAYKKQGNSSQDSYACSEVLFSYDTEKTVPYKSSVKDLKDGKGKRGNNDIKLRSGLRVRREVNCREKTLKNRSEPVDKNVSSNALSNTGYIFKTIRESYNLSYMPLKKIFCDNSQYQLTDGDAIVMNAKREEFPVTYSVSSNYNFIGRGWRKFCEQNGARIGDRYAIRIIGDNKFLVSFMHP